MTQTAAAKTAAAPTITIAPVRKSIRVNAPQARAFDVFTSKLGQWWPRKASIGAAPMKTAVIEAGVGGRWIEIGEDGSQTPVGRVLVWEPPHRLVTVWEINGSWKADTTVGSEVEVRFIAEGPGMTRIELEHRKFERLGAEAGEKVRGHVDQGWPGILELLKGAIEDAAKGDENYECSRNGENGQQ
jgi:uncharacterized protein YndB with AHSA1/START domain